MISLVDYSCVLQTQFDIQILTDQKYMANWLSVCLCVCVHASRKALAKKIMDTASGNFIKNLQAEKQFHAQMCDVSQVCVCVCVVCACVSEQKVI